MQVPSQTVNTEPTQLPSQTVNTEPTQLPSQSVNTEPTQLPSQTVNTETSEGIIATNKGTCEGIIATKDIVIDLKKTKRRQVSKDRNTLKKRISKRNKASNQEQDISQTLCPDSLDLENIHNYCKKANSLVNPYSLDLCPEYIKCIHNYCHSVVPFDNSLDFTKPQDTFASKKRETWFNDFTKLGFLHGDHSYSLYTKVCKLFRFFPVGDLQQETMKNYYMKNGSKELMA